MREDQKIKLTPEQEQKVQELKNMSPEQWDSICKKCGLCCIEKVCIGPWPTFENIHYMNVCCDYLDIKTRRCTRYDRRLTHPITSCEKVNIDTIINKPMLPQTCGYVEYVFGPAEIKIKPKWENFKHNAQVNLNDDEQVIKLLIANSNKWNRRDKSR